MLYASLSVLCGVVYVILRIAGEPRSELFVLAAGAFVFGIVAMNREIDRHFPRD